MRNESSAAISMRSAVSQSTRAMSLFSKRDSSIQLYRVGMVLLAPPGVVSIFRSVCGGDLHEIGGLPEHARDVLVLQTGFLHPIVSGQNGPFGSAARRFYMQQRRLVCSVVVLTFLAGPAVLAQSAPFTVVNAASYGSAIAPDSLATIFGSNLAQGTASATLDANGQLPT